MYRKRSRCRRRRERSNDESKAAIDGDGGDTRTGAGDDGVGGCIDGDTIDESVGGCTGGGGGDRHNYRTETVDDGLENNPDIIPHDNGEQKSVLFFFI